MNLQVVTLDNYCDIINGMTTIIISNDLIQELASSGTYMDYNVIRRVDEKMQTQLDNQNDVMDCFQMFDTVIESIRDYYDAMISGFINVNNMNSSEINVCDNVNLWLPCGYVTKNSTVIVKNESYNTIRQFALKGTLIPKRKKNGKDVEFTSHWIVGKYYDTTTRTADLDLTDASNHNVNIYDNSVNDYAHSVMRTPYIDTGASMRTSPVITVDCDDSLLKYRLLLLKHYRIPLPQVITINPMKGTFQMHWIMSKCYYRFNRDEMPELSKLNDDKHARMYDEVRWSLTYLLHGDVGFTNNRRRNILDNVCSIRLVLSDYVNVNKSRTQRVHPYRVNRNGVIVNNGTGGAPEYDVDYHASINVNPTVINPVDKYDVNILHSAIEQAGILLSQNRLYSYYNMKAHLYESTGCIIDDVMNMTELNDMNNDCDSIDNAGDDNECNNAGIDSERSSDLSENAGSDSMTSDADNYATDDNDGMHAGRNAGVNCSAGHAVESGNANTTVYDNARLSTVSGIIGYVNDKYGEKITYKNGSVGYVIPEGHRNEAVFNFAQIAYYHGFDARLFVSKLKLSEGYHSYSKKEMMRTVKSVYDYYYYNGVLPDALITNENSVSTIHNGNDSNSKYADEDDYALMYSLFNGSVSQNANAVNTGVSNGNNSTVNHGGFKVNTESIFKKYYKDKLGSDKELVIEAGYKTRTRSKTIRTVNNTITINVSNTDDNADRIISASELSSSDSSSDANISASKHVMSSMSISDDYVNEGASPVIMSDVADSSDVMNELSLHVNHDDNDDEGHVMLGSLSLDGLTGSELKRAIYKHNAAVNGRLGGCKHTVRQVQTRSLNGLRTSADKILKAIIMRDSMFSFITKIGSGIIDSFISDTATVNVNNHTYSSNSGKSSGAAGENSETGVSGIVYADIRKTRNKLNDKNMSKITGYSVSTVHRKYQEFMRMMYEYVKHVPVTIGNVSINDCSKTRKYDALYEYLKHDRRLYGAALISAAVKSGLMLTLAVQGLSFKPYADDSSMNGKWLGIIGSNSNANINGYNDRTPEQMIIDGLMKLTESASRNDAGILVNSNDNNDDEEKNAKKNAGAQSDSHADGFISDSDLHGALLHDGTNDVNMMCSQWFIDRIIKLSSDDYADSSSSQCSSSCDYDVNRFTDDINVSSGMRTYAEYYELFKNVSITADAPADKILSIRALNNRISSDLRVLLTHDVSMDGFDSTDEVFIDDDLFDEWLDYQHVLNSIVHPRVLTGSDEYTVVHVNMFTNLVSMIKHVIMSCEPAAFISNDDYDTVIASDCMSMVGASSEAVLDSHADNDVVNSDSKHDALINAYMRKHGISPDSHDTDEWLNWFTEDTDSDVFDL